MYNKSMATVTFDTLKFVECLKEHDFTEEQAKGLSEAFKEAQDSSLQEFATKGDIKELKHEIKTLDNKIDTLELRLTIKLGALVTIGIAIVATLVKLL